MVVVSQTFFKCQLSGLIVPAIAWLTVSARTVIEPSKLLVFSTENPVSEPQDETSNAVLSPQFEGRYNTPNCRPLPDILETVHTAEK